MKHKGKKCGWSVSNGAQELCHLRPSLSDPERALGSRGNHDGVSVVGGGGFLSKVCNGASLPVPVLTALPITSSQ